MKSFIHFRTKFECNQHFLHLGSSYWRASDNYYYVIVLLFDVKIKLVITCSTIKYAVCLILFGAIV